MAQEGTAGSTLAITDEGNASSRKSSHRKAGGLLSRPISNVALAASTFRTNGFGMLCCRPAVPLADNAAGKEL